MVRSPTTTETQKPLSQTDHRKGPLFTTGELTQDSKTCSDSAGLTLHMLQQVTHGVDIAECKFKALDASLGGSQVVLTGPLGLPPSGEG